LAALVVVVVVADLLFPAVIAVFAGSDLAQVAQD